MRRCSRKWIKALPWMIVLSILAGCAMGVYIQRYETPVYRAVYTFYAVAEGHADASTENARILARDCALLTHTDTFRSTVLKDTHSDGKTSVDVQAVYGTHMLKVSANGPDSAIVHSLVNAVGDALVEQIPRLFHAQGVREIERAALPLEPSDSNAALRIAAAMLAMFAASGLLVCCLPGGMDRLSACSPETERFRLGAVGDTCRLVKQFLKQKQHSGMLLYQADRFIREEIRQLVLVLRNTAPKQTGRSLVLTSMRPGEEDAALAVLLASEMAQQGFRVLLMEMDAHKPSMSALLGVRARADLWDYFNGRAELNEVIQPTQLRTLSFVDALHPACSVADLAATAPFASFVRSAEEHFDFVILHAAPRAVSSDASMLGLIADSLLLLARDETYTLQEIEAAAREMARLGKPARGVVFTRVHAR